jgi:type II secretion system protein I
MAKEKTLIHNQQGFTLMEVVIAISIFAVFATAFMSSQGQNLIDSSKLKTEMTIKDLCQNKINEVIANPPELRDSRTLAKDEKDFDDNPNYHYSIEYKKFFVPDLSKLSGNDDNKGEQSSKEQLLKRIFKVYKENMEKMLWQIEVVVKDKTTGEEFKLSTWLYNQDADVKVSL